MRGQEGEGLEQVAAVSEKLVHHMCRKMEGVGMESQMSTDFTYMIE